MRRIPRQRDRWEVLPELTSEDLKEHRRCSRSATAASCSMPSPRSALQLPRRGRDGGSPRCTGSRRCRTPAGDGDVLRSGRLDRALGAARSRRICARSSRAYQRAVAETVAAFDGFVAKYMGDGVLVYFGYPQAHEDDAERAVRAGLALIDAVGRLDVKSAELQSAGRHRHRAGGRRRSDRRGRGAGASSRRRDAEPRRAAASARCAGQRWSSPPARGSRSASCSIWRTSDRKRLAGFAEPQRAWRVLGESAMVSRFEALRSGATPLVGRDEEVELLLRRWEQAKSGEGRVVLISGEPGIGKSRLTAALSEHIANRAPYALALFLLAAPPGQRALSLHRPARTRRRVRPRRHGRSQARQTAGAARARARGMTTISRC